MIRKTLVLAALLALGAVPATAEHPKPTRILNDHHFIPSVLVSDPFAISFFRTGTGGGMAFDVDSPFVDTNGDTLGVLTGDVGFLSLDFEYQQHFWKRFAGRAGFSGSARLGVDEQSVLAQGVTGTVSFSFGLTGEILRREQIVLSAAIDAGRSNFVGLDTFGFAQTVIDSGLTKDNELVSTNDALTTVVGVRVAWAPTAYLGVFGLLEVGGADITTEDGRDTSFGGGAGVSFDLNPLFGVPIGALVSGESEGTSQNGSDLSNRSYGMGLGVFYTGWDDFSVGFETTRRTLKRRGEGSDFSAMIAQFNLRYFPHL
jgi:hypothetical protein